MFVAVPSTAVAKRPARLRVGTSSGIFGGLDNMNYDNFVKARAAGIECLELSASTVLLDKRYTDDNQIEERCRQLKRDADAAGLDIWSIHMAFGRDIDISQTNDSLRCASVELHRRLLKFCAIFSPKIILFHPSWYLGIDEREARMSQLALSVRELNPLVRKMGATMVIENMLGYELRRSQEYERPLCRTVEEMLHVMSLLPSSVRAAVDTNHIDNPEQLIAALGRKVRSVHISDGDGRNECHELPWHGAGDNDWVAILRALDHNAHYTGPFMYEVSKSDFDSLTRCYDRMYDDYLATLPKRRK